MGVFTPLGRQEAKLLLLNVARHLVSSSGDSNAELEELLNQHAPRVDGGYQIINTEDN